MTDGWDASAAAWIAEQSDRGDWIRRHVLDGPMLERVRAGTFANALDIGCGEGRFCRLLQQDGIATVGIDPTEALLARARSLDQAGDYRAGRAERLDVADATFDLVVSYLSLIDIPDLAAVIPEMARVLRPGGALLIANLASFATAAVAERGWAEDRFAIDRYLEERANWAEWSGIRVHNWHRPLSRYIDLLLRAGLSLTHFAEPEPTDADPARSERYRRVPLMLIMEWRKPYPSAGTLPSVQPPPSAL